MINKNLIKTDLYEAVNKDYLEKMEIPSDRKSMGAFAKIDMDIEKQLLHDFKTLNFDDEFVSDEMVNYLRFYRSIVDNKNRSITDNHIVFDMINEIQSINSKESLNKVIIKFTEMGISSLIDMEIEPSFKDSNLNILYLDVTKNILPSKEYYQDDDKKIKLLNVYTDMMKEIFYKFNIENVDYILDNTLKLDEKIVEYVRSSVELADYVKLYNPTTIEEINKYSDLVDFELIIKNLINKPLGEISITQPKFFENFSKLFTLDNLEEIKSLLLSKFIYSVSDLFDEELRYIASKFSKAISGVEEIEKLEKFAYIKAMELYSQVVGIYYGKKYFGEEAKKDIYNLVDDLLNMYKKRLTNNTWLQDSTKEKAILKLSTMKVLMAYPDSVPEVYKTITYDDNLSMYENYIDNKKKFVKDNMNKYNEKVDHTLWYMPACMVNAFYNASANSICFPAAILNEPFYSLNQSVSKNFGGIGAVIGHEISHAFDNNGANFDENGNLNNWWSEEDFKKFKEFTNKMIEQFDGIEMYGGKVNGQLVVSENLADVGGLACAIACLKEKENYSLEELFINWARVWSFKGRDEYMEYLLKVDVHAPTKLRANMQPRNMDDFYSTFDVKEGDEMYLKPEERIIVW